MIMISVLAGLFSGIVSGLGIGGGAVLIPVLVLGMSVPQKIAQSVNLIYFVPTAISALCVHFCEKRIEVKIAFSYILYGIIGAVLGVTLMQMIDTFILKKLFASFLMAMGFYEIIQSYKTS